jgi:hypothetical protein
MVLLMSRAPLHLLNLGLELKKLREAKQLKDVDLLVV